MVIAAGESNTHASTNLETAEKALKEVDIPTGAMENLASSVSTTHEFIRSERETIQGVLQNLEALKSIFHGISERTAAHAASIAGEHLPKVHETVDENTALKRTI